MLLAFVRTLGLIAGLLACLAVRDVAATLVVDRGLPVENLNSAAGASRSNVAWDFNPPETYISGDDFLLPDPGAATPKWRIDTIRVWVVAGSVASTPAFELGDRYDTVSLFLGETGPDGTSIDRVKSAGILAGSHATDNPDVVITPVTYAGGEDYQGSSGSFIQIWQIDFNDLGIFDPGPLMFAVDGVGAADFNWFNHASNAALSGSPQQGSDDQMRWFEGNASGTSITLGGLWDSNGYGWDKSSDHNIQVFATAVPEPGTWFLLILGIVVLSAAAGIRQGRSPVREYRNGREAGRFHP